MTIDKYPVNLDKYLSKVETANEVLKTVGLPKFSK
jgi:hypothetical protein